MKATQASASERVALAAFVVFALVAATPSRAQSWLPEQGSFAYSLDWNDTYNKHHYDSRGHRIDAGHTRIFSSILSASYSPTDRWAIVAGLPYVRARYQGAFPHPTVVDDGDYHGALTDLRVEAHYQLIDGAFAVAPFVGIVTPVTDYETLGHAAPGRGLSEASIGTFIGASFDRWVPKTYLQLRLNYSFVERVVGVKHDRINADAEIGYFFTPEWSARLVVNFQDTDGGINVPAPLDDELFPHHDQLAATRFLNMGGGGAWTISDNLRTYFLYSAAIHGRNGHMLDSSITFGLSYAGLR